MPTGAGSICCWLPWMMVSIRSGSYVLIQLIIPFFEIPGRPGERKWYQIRCRLQLRISFFGINIYQGQGSAARISRRSSWGYVSTRPVSVQILATDYLFINKNKQNIGAIFKNNSLSFEHVWFIFNAK
jgi:hypothetical protein